MNYTDGEWTPYQLRSNNVSICVKTEGDLVAVEIASLNTLLGYDTVVANACLIAAGPRMAQLLERLVKEGWNASISEEAKEILQTIA